MSHAMNDAEKQNVANVGVGSMGGSAGPCVAALLAQAASLGVRVVLVDSVPLTAPDITEMVVKASKEWEPKLADFTPEKEWWRGGRPR